MAVRERPGDQVIRENPASRGTETSAEVLAGPPGRMVSNAGPQTDSSGTREREREKHPFARSKSYLPGQYTGR